MHIVTFNTRACLSQDDYNIGPQHMTYLPSLYGPSNMKFNGKDHFIVDPNEQRWQQTILKRYIFSSPLFLRCFDSFDSPESMMKL